MKILTGIDVPFLPFGGSLLCANDWYSNLPDDVEVRFLTMPPTDGKKWWTIEDVVMLDIEKARSPEAYPEYIEKLKAAIMQQVEEFQPDVIHCQHLNYGLSRAFAELNLDIPRIGICHGTDVQIATQISFFKDNLTYICDNLDLLLFPNETMKNDFFAVYGKQKSYEINALGIPDRYFDNTARSLSFDGTRPLQLLYAGRLVAWKGADIAVESMLHTQNVELTVIGNEDQKGYKAEMETFVAQHDLGKRVTFKPQLDRDELLDEFAHYDAIIFPSRSLEAFSLTVVEAQTKGIPVICNPGGGITDTVGDGGIMIRDNTPEDVAALLDDLYAHPQQLRDVQARGYKNAEKYKVSISKKNLFDLSRRLTRREG